MPFEQLVAEYRGVLVRRARHLCRGRFDPDDLVQEVHMRALRNYGTLRNSAQPLPWLLTILNRTFVDLVRKRSSEPQGAAIEEMDVPEPPPEPLPIWSALTEEHLLAAIERLPEDVRECYRLHALEDWDYARIAKTLNIPSGTVGTRLLRARRKLRELLQADKAGGES
jgi:RNA polymerase sigma-70 factor (ECF subfamily)